MAQRNRTTRAERAAEREAAENATVDPVTGLRTFAAPPSPKDTDPVSWKEGPLHRAALFLGILIAMSWAFWFAAGITTDSLDQDMHYSDDLVTASMIIIFSPVLAGWTANTILGPRYRRPMRGRLWLRYNKGLYLAAWLVPFALAGLGALLYFGLFPSDFYRLGERAFIYRFGWEWLGLDLDMPYGTASTLVLLFTVIAMPFFMMLIYGGGELGWRGFFYPLVALELGPRRAALVTAVACTLWLTPLLAMGFDYGTDAPCYPVVNVAVYLIYSVAMSVCLCWLRERTDSVWPAVLAHSSLAAPSALILACSFTGRGILGPVSTGLVAMIPMLCLAVRLWCKMPKETSCR